MNLGERFFFYNTSVASSVNYVSWMVLRSFTTENVEIS